MNAGVCEENVQLWGRNSRHRRVAGTGKVLLERKWWGDDRKCDAVRRLGPGAMRIGCKNTWGPNKANQFTPQETQLRDSVCLLEEYCSRIGPISILDSAQRPTSNNCNWLDFTVVSFCDVRVLRRILSTFQCFCGLLFCLFTYLCITATELRAERSGIESRWERGFPPVQTGPGAHPTSCKMGTGSFSGIKCGRGVLLTTHPLLVSWSSKSRTIPLPTLWATPGL